MEKVIYDEKNGLWYELQGDYYIPCLKLPEEEQQPIGVWGQRHLRYIKQNRKVLYLNLLTSGKLNGYLSDLDKQAEEIFSRLVEQMAEREGVTEKLRFMELSERTATEDAFLERIISTIREEVGKNNPLGGLLQFVQTPSVQTPAENEEAVLDFLDSF